MIMSYIHSSFQTIYLFSVYVTAHVYFTKNLQCKISFLCTHVKDHELHGSRSIEPFIFFSVIKYSVTEPLITDFVKIVLHRH